MKNKYTVRIKWQNGGPKAISRFSTLDDARAEVDHIGKTMAGIKLIYLKSNMPNEGTRIFDGKGNYLFSAISG
jgi:hypothetical protein